MLFYRDNFVIEHLSKIATEFKNTLACLSGAQIGLNHGKNGGQIFCDTLPIILFTIVWLEA